MANFDPYGVPTLRERWHALALDAKVFLSLLVFAALAAPVGWLWVRPAYRQWQQDQALHAARQALDAKNIAGFRIAVQRFAGSPAGTAANWAEAATMLDPIDNKDAQKVWREALRRAPENTSYRLGYLDASLRAGDLAAAGAIVKQADARLQAEPGFHPLAARYYLRTGNSHAAQAEFDRSLASGPEDISLLLEYGTLLVSSDQPARRDHGVELLEQASRNADARPAALRALFRHDLSAKWHYAAGRNLEALLALPNPSFPDHLFTLELDLARTHHVDPAHFAAVAQLATSDPAHLQTLTDWLLARGLVAEVRQLPEKVGASTPAAAGLPLLHLRLACLDQDWARASRIAREDMKNAFAADALDAAVAEDGQEKQDTNWREPLDRAGADPVALDLLRTYYTSAGQPRKEMPVIQAMVDRSPTDLSLWSRLFELCRITQDTPMLRRFTSELAKITGNPPELAGEVLTLDLLTDRISSSEALETAREMRASNPASPAAANAQAFALARLGRGAEAVDIYRRFPDQAWIDPGRAVLYGYALAQAGDLAGAEAKFELAESQRDRLLIELQVLMRKTRATIEHRPLSDSTDPAATPAVQNSGEGKGEMGK